jgi:U6 snRNA-associated Sm-like protein LSm7
MSSSHTKKPHAAGSASTVPKKDSILELSKLQDQVVRVKCPGGRELQGVLRGYDELVNLVLDDCEEFLRTGKDWTTKMLAALIARPHTEHTSFVYYSTDDTQQTTGKTRRLGLVVIRGTQVSVVMPHDGVEEIANPFVAAAAEEE